MPKDPYALLRALLRAEAARDVRAARAARAAEAVAPPVKNERRAPSPQNRNGR